MAPVILAVAVVLALVAGCTTSPSGGSDAVATSLRDDVERALDATLYAEAVRAVLVYQDGKPVLERYTDASPGDYQDVESVTTSVLSTLVGIAIGDGLIRDTGLTLGELLPEYARAMRPAVASTNLDDLLTMSGGFSGVDAAETARLVLARDPVLAMLGSPRSRPKGEFWYSEVSAHLVSVILTRATGMSVLAYARRKLFDPLGIDTRPAAQPLASPRNDAVYRRAGFAWPVDRLGHNLGWSLLKLRPADLAKLGMLYLDGGRWHGEPVVPKRWVREATRTHLATDRLAQGYGYLWYVGSADGAAAYLASGRGGQMLEVVPSRGLVVVFCASLDVPAPGAAGISPDFPIALVDTVIAPHFRPGS